MIHSRNRLALTILAKRLRYFPVVAIQGARQTGKSFLARELLRKLFKSSKYLSFDQQTTLTYAKEQPHSFLKEYSVFSPIIIDEAQKVPHIFDAIKYEVDTQNRPGRFLLLGSTEFSHLTKIRESLTGRLGRIRLYPMNIKETLGHHLKKLVPTRKQLIQYLASGGMPAIFSISDSQAKTALFEDWVQLTCTRDLLQLKALKLDPDLTYQILVQCAKQDWPDSPSIARALRENSRRVQTHLKGLCELFVLHCLNAYPSSKGKPLYLLLDPGVANYLGATVLRRLHITLLNERLCKNTYSNEKKKSFYYYRSTSKNLIHLIEESLDNNHNAFQLVDFERIKKTDVELMRSFLSRNPATKGCVYAPIFESIKINTVLVQPWEKFTA